MADPERAVQFVERNAGPVERARLAYLLSGQSPPAAVLLEFQSTQREDGGWPPFWAPEYSSVDATCFRLAQAAQMGLTVSVQPFLARALAFLRSRQSPDGYWEEDLAQAERTPPWARPGDPAARLYLTANCAFWLSKADAFLPQAVLAGEVLSTRLDEKGLLPSFPQANWLAAPAFYRLGLLPPFEGISARLVEQVEGFSAAELAWLLNAYLDLETPAARKLVERAGARLAALQRPDGAWPSDDGPALDANTTLQALFVLSRYHFITLP